MKIVHIITRLIIGGAQENTLLSCQGQHDAGHEVTLITGPAIGPEGSLLERAKSHGYRVEILDDMRRAIRPGRDYRVYRHLLRRLKELKPDIVHTHSSKAGIIGRRAAHKASIPAIIHTIHGLAFTASTSRLVNHAYKLLERNAAPLTTKIVCVADAMRDQSLAGVPTITYDIDGAKEGTLDGQTGFVLPPFDAKKLSAAIAMLLQDPARRRDMGALGRQFALKRFDAKVMVDALEGVYTDALQCTKQ